MSSMITVEGNSGCQMTWHPKREVRRWKDWTGESWKLWELDVISWDDIKSTCIVLFATLVYVGRDFLVRSVRDEQKISSFGTTCILPGVGPAASVQVPQQPGNGDWKKPDSVPITPECAMVNGRLVCCCLSCFVVVVVVWVFIVCLWMC